MEKFRTWSDCGGDVERKFTKDELLTNITIYWATETINSSTRLYYESQRVAWNLKEGERIEVPTGVAVFPQEISHPPREWAERSYNLQRWTQMPRGGHFAAQEEPEAAGRRHTSFLPALARLIPLRVDCGGLPGCHNLSSRIIRGKDDPDVIGVGRRR